jgi:alkaline phosphatase D
MPTPSTTRRQFLTAGAALSVGAVASGAETIPDEVIGPLVGHTDTSTAYLWARFPKPGRYSLSVQAEGKGEAKEYLSEATATSDNTAKWKIEGLSPATKYRVNLSGGRPCSFTTPPANDKPAKVTIALGSCADEDASTRAVWTRMAAENADAVILGGDTPYIDSTNLAKQRSRHRAFAAVTEYQSLLSTRPFWSTWDDHDFGKNDADGNLPGKENSRQAFLEYRAQAQYGTGKEGIYTSFRWGPIEFFIIDARWWAYTGPSFADPKQKTLLGKAQWEWLQKGLAASTAPFKVLTVGCVWEDKKNKEKDHWETYLAERDALFRFIKEKQIGGVVLFGGDIHVTRVLRYPPKYVGYPLYDFISSPMHARVIPSLNIPHPYLIHSKVQPNTFLTLTADTTLAKPTLTARFLDTAGRSLFPDTMVTLDELTPKET